MTKQKKDWLAVALFLLVFGILLFIASNYDLQISQFLTRHTLEGQTYITNDNSFAVLMEIIGPEPSPLLLELAFSILFWYAIYFWQGFKKYFFSGLFSLCTVAANYYMAFDVLNYVRQHLYLNPDPDYANGNWLMVFYLTASIFLTVLDFLAAKNLSKETVRKLFRFAIASILLVAIPNTIINLGIKSYVGRIRYRAMNMYPTDELYGFTAYATWHEHNGQWLDDVQMTSHFGNTDVLKSFPSGHTASTGMFYALIMLIDALGIQNKKTKAFLWILPIALTGCVAVGRIMVGAHFMSDVLIGGTFSFLTMLLLRELIVNHCANFKALFGKDSK